MMFPRIEIHAVEKISVNLRLCRGTAAAAIVSHLRGWRESHLPARISYSSLPVGFLRVHEESLIEATHLLPGFSAHHHAGAADKIDLPLGVMRPPPVITDNRMIPQHGANPEL